MVFSGSQKKGSTILIKPVSSEIDQHKLYYHKLGTSQSDDKLVYGGTPEEKHRYVGARVTEDGKYLFLLMKIF